MSIPKIPLPGKIFLSILSAKWDKFWPELLDILTQKWGENDYLSEPIAFTQTEYYNAELGTPIFRRVLSFQTLVPLDCLAQLKLFTNALEQQYACKNKRIFNLDPGLITYERLVLATGKNFTHRIYLKKGIFADLTLIYVKGKWQDLPWTFPDYRTPIIKEHLTQIREIYKEQVESLRRTK